MYEGPYTRFIQNECCYYLGPVESASPHNFDIAKKSDLTRLYNSKVYKAEKMRRPLGRLPMMGIISHTGVVLVPLFTHWIHKKCYQRVHCLRE